MYSVQCAECGLEFGSDGDLSEHKVMCLMRKFGEGNSKMLTSLYWEFRFHNILKIMHAEKGNYHDAFMLHLERFNSFNELVDEGKKSERGG